jgi:hypothetical protein
MLMRMNPLASCAFLIATAKNLVAAVTTRDNLHLRPQFACKAVAERLVCGMRLLRAYLRRLVILIALELEWSLIDTRGVLKRPHGRKAKPSSAKFSLQGLDPRNASSWPDDDDPPFKTQVTISDRRSTPIPVYMGRLYAQLDFLAGIAANPLAKAKRLAFHLARNRPYNKFGVIMAPDGPHRIAGRWGTEVSATYDAMWASIMTKSRARPPPIPPRRRRGPTIERL